MIAGTIKAEKRWAENNGIEVIDIALMLEELDIDPATDYYDSTHLNISGATKVGKYLAKYFEKFNIEENTIQDIKWKNDLEMYEKTYH